MRDIPVGTPVWSSLAPFEVRGTKPVRLTSARILGVPHGMEVMGIWGINSPEIGFGGIIGAIGDRDELLRRNPSLRLHPVREVVLRPGRDDWELLVQLRATKPGKWRTKGIRVFWDGGNRDYPYYVIGLATPGVCPVSAPVPCFPGTSWQERS